MVKGPSAGPVTLRPGRSGDGFPEPQAGQQVVANSADSLGLLGLAAGGAGPQA